MKQISLLVTVLFILLLSSSCKSKHEETVQKIKEVSTLLDNASRASETEFDVPLGLKLNCKESDINSFCESLVDKDVRMEGENLIIRTSEFGNVERDVKIQFLFYHTDKYDKDTKTDIVSQIAFAFEEFRADSLSNGGWTVLKDAISKDFDGTWKHVEFDLKNIKEEPNEYFKPLRPKDYYSFWIKGNMAVEFAYYRRYKIASLRYLNAPKIGTESIMGMIYYYAGLKNNNSTIEGSGSVKNSPWNGSVMQVKNYLKKTLKDPDSYESIEWGKVIESNGNYEVKHTYRAKNSFGGYVIETCLFKLDSHGNVIEVVKME